MPNYEVDTAKEEIAALREEISGERAYYEDVVKGMQDDKARFEEDQRVNYLALKSRYTEVMESLHHKEQYNGDIVMDQIELKHIYELEERAKQEENEQMN